MRVRKTRSIGNFKSKVKTTVQTCDNDTSSNAYAATAESNNLHV